MTRKLIKLALISFVCISVLSLALPAAAQSTVIKVEVFPNGDAHWTTEKMIPLDTADDVAGWDATAAQGTDSYYNDFKSKMTDYVARISSSLGRNMTVKDVNVSVEKSQPYALSDNGSHTYGVIRYDFTWTGFAMTNGDALEVGDSFIDGFLLNVGDSITFTLPEGYDITSISPDPDDYRKALEPQVKWTVGAAGANSTDSNIRLFPSGEPSIIMKKSVAASAVSFDWWMLLPVMLISAIIGFGAAYLLFLRKPADKAPPMPDLEPRAGATVPDVGEEMTDTTMKMREELPSPDEGRFMTDEERIVRYLEDAGGQMFQSDLVKKTDFSKSKLSMVLSDLKEKGTILKIKKGKENLIRLNRPSGDRPEEQKD